MPLELADRSAALVDLELGLDAVPGVLEIPGAEDEIGRGVIGPAELGDVDAGLVLQDREKKAFLFRQVGNDAHTPDVDARLFRLERHQPKIRSENLVAGQIRQNAQVWQ
jgi:hypothetical protein